ncbi:hypothetical protein HHL23_05140 [Chryseobacterium sp. RP-3-3]|uniref:Uncharacterized protein n=1 Tax=Chryseobacterium antibioticum TaxID=2728847 RepID=A0A7Y0AKX1_9FLAO|nr:hypothetical protein [Chryseobacterium antibioticum]NML69176.1 hypothetical protein [Chryseobacterium antibioticum]
MKIKILNGTQEFNLYFNNKEDLQKVHAQIVEAVTDPNNTKGAHYLRDGDSKLFPSLFLKKGSDYKSKPNFLTYTLRGIVS